MNSALTVHKGKILEHQDLGLWEGEIVTHIPEKKNPALTWKGTKLPDTVLKQCLAFFRWGDSKFNSEVQVRLFYNPVTKAWMAQAMPQWVGTGMTTKEIDVSTVSANVTNVHKQLRATIMQRVLGAGFHPNGTNHSHCDSGAFQSGEDLNDELGQPGLHVTMGKVNSKACEIHGRVSFRNVLYDINYNDWFYLNTPIKPEENIKLLDWETGLPEDEEALKTMFPAEWVDCCFVKPKPVFSYNPKGFYSQPYHKSSSWDFDKKTWKYNYEDEDEGEDYQWASASQSSGVPVSETDFPDTLIKMKDYITTYYSNLSPDDVTPYALALLMDGKEKRATENRLNGLSFDDTDKYMILDMVDESLGNLSSAIDLLGQAVSELLICDAEATGAYGDSENLFQDMPIAVIKPMSKLVTDKT